MGWKEQADARMAMMYSSGSHRDGDDAADSTECFVGLDLEMVVCIVVVVMIKREREMEEKKT